MKLIGSVEIQYITCLFDNSSHCIEAERRHRLNPLMEIYYDDINLYFYFIIKNIDIKERRSRSAKERSDIYFLKPAATCLIELMNIILPKITEKTTLNQSQRERKDPRSTYDNLGLPLPIERIGSFVKIEYFKCRTNTLNKQMVRRKEITQKPYMMVDLEPKYNIDRLHFGFIGKWEDLTTLDNSDRLEVKINGKEIGHLIESLAAIVSDMREN